VHLDGFALDGIPDGIAIGIAAIRQNELPLRKIHLVRRSVLHHFRRLFGRSWGRLDRNLRAVCFGCSEELSPAVVARMELHILRASILFHLRSCSWWGDRSRACRKPDSVLIIRRSLTEICERQGVNNAEICWVGINRGTQVLYRASLIFVLQVG